MRRRELLTGVAALAISAGLSCRAPAITPMVERKVLVGGNNKPISPLLFSQNWDGATAPAIPSGWTMAPSGQVTTSTAHAASGTNGLAFAIDNTSATSAVNNVVDPHGGNVLVASKLFFVNGTGTTQEGGVFARGQGSVLGSGLYPTDYSAFIISTGAGQGLGLNKNVAGTATSLATVATANITPGVWYRLILECNGSTIAVKLRRETDGVWLTSSGAWTATESYAISVTDSSVTGSGTFGEWSYQTTASAITYHDDFELYAAATTMAPATALRIGPTNKTTFAGIANHRTVYAVSIFTDGSLASPLSVSLSDGGAGGRFFVGAQSFAPISSVSIPANAKLGNVTVFYAPPYNQTTSPTITAASSLGSATTAPGITGYATTGAPTPSNLSFDQVLTATFNNQWSALPFDISGGFVSGLSGYTKIVDNNGGVETVSGGVYSRLNASQANQVFYRANSALVSNAYNIEIEIVAWGGGATDQVLVGVAVDGSNYYAASVDNANGNIKILSYASGTPTQIGSAINTNLPPGSKIQLSIGVQYPTTTTALLSVWYMKPGDTAYTLGTYGNANAYSLSLLSTLATLYPFWGTNQAANTAVQVTGFTCGHAGTLICPFNSSVIKDITTGAPLLSPDGTSIYVYGESDLLGSTGNAIYKWNTQTWAFTEVARVIVNDGTYNNLGPLTLGYNPNTSTWIVMAANWATNFGTAAIVPSYATTTADLLSGVNAITVSPLPLPSTAASGAGSPVTVYDADIILQGTTYTAAYIITDGAATWTNRALAVATATSLAGPWTQQWETTLAGGRYDGARISQVGGVKIALGSNNITSMNAFNLSTGASLGSLVNATVDSLAGNNFVTPTVAACHASLAPIPAEVGGHTRYVLPLFQQESLDLTGLPKVLTPVSFLWCFEATQRYTSAEFTWITAS